MSMAATSISATEALARVDDVVKLARVRRALATPESGRGDSTERRDIMEGEYRKFLALQLAFPQMEIVPCRGVDEIWHGHILDTKAYAEDCDSLFGEFLHHCPHFGVGRADGRDGLDAAYKETLRLYRAAFGEPALGTWIPEPAADLSMTAGCSRDDDDDGDLTDDKVDERAAP